MKMKQKLLSSTIAASALALSALAPVAQAESEVSASIGAASMYYWRGLDLGAGDAAVWGDISVSNSGFYAGLWTSSGDAGQGTEFDVYVGYGAEFGDLSVDVSYASYIYPETEVGFGDVAEAIIGLGYGPMSFTYHHGLGDLGDNDYAYVNVAVEFGAFTLAFGMHSDDEDLAGEDSLDSVSHIDVTYAYNENLSFTLGKIIDDGDGKANDEAKFLVSFSLPF